MKKIVPVLILMCGGAFLMAMPEVKPAKKPFGVDWCYKHTTPGDGCWPCHAAVPAPPSECIRL